LNQSNDDDYTLTWY